MSSQNTRVTIPSPETTEAVNAVFAFAEAHQLDPAVVGDFVAQIGQIVVPPEADIERNRIHTGRSISQGTPVRSYEDSLAVHEDVSASNRTYEGAKTLGRVIRDGIKSAVEQVSLKSEAERAQHPDLKVVADASATEETAQHVAA